MKIIKIFYLLLIMTISGCGFQPLYKIGNENNFSINKIFQSGNKNINRKIISKIDNIEKKDVFYNLTIDSKETEQVLNKDKLGNIILTKLSIEVNIKLTDPTNKALVFKEKKFISQYVYKNNENKFESSQTIKIKKDDLINKIIENIIIFLRF
tara:strand:- start:753 stop:1211 length:459 start_codon:yes stop_codon:yes gene_type:complete